MEEQRAELVGLIKHLERNERVRNGYIKNIEKMSDEEVSAAMERWQQAFDEILEDMVDHALYNA